MSLGKWSDAPKITYLYMQPTELFHTQNVLDYCEYREREIEKIIHGIPHTEVLTWDRETIFTRLVNTYLSDESTNYPILDRDKAELLGNSDQTKVMALYRIPWTGDQGFFTYRPVNECDPPSAEVTINLNQADKVITLYYEFARDDAEENFQERLQELLNNDISWIVRSLDDVIRHFREHESRLKSIMGKALAQRIETVFSIEGCMESIELSEDVFQDKLSVMRDSVFSHERSPGYDVFKPILFARQAGQCNGTKLEIYYSESTVDHVVPKDEGGGDELRNLQVLCGPCNVQKDNGPQDAYASMIKKDPSICAGYEPQTD